MKKILLFLSPILLAIVVFFTLTLFVNGQSNGKGALQITSTPQSTVYLNGKPLGKTPLCKCEGGQMLATGDYTIRLVPTDSSLQPFEQKITINKSVLTVVDQSFGQGATSMGSIINLSPLTTKDVQLFVSSFPNNAKVLVDSNPVGQTPLLLKNLTESDHQISIQEDGYKEKDVKIHTVAGYKLSALIFLAIDPQALHATGTDSATLQTNSGTPTPTQGVAKVTILDTPTGFLRVRDQASLTGNEIAQVKPGESYILLSEQTGWYQIQLTGGKSGWVSSQYASK